MTSIVTQALPTGKREFKSRDPDVIILGFPIEIQERFAHLHRVREAGLADTDRRYDARIQARRERDSAVASKSHFLQSCADDRTKPPQDQIDAFDAKIQQVEKRIRALDRETKIRILDLEPVQNFIRSLRPDEVRVADVREPDSLDGLVTDQLADATASVEQAKRALAEAEALPRSAEEGLQELQRQIAELASRGKPRVDALFHADDFDDRGRFRPSRRLGKIRFPTDERDGSPDFIALMAWLCRDELEARLVALAKEVAPSNGCDLQEKVRRVEVAQQRLVECLRFENEVLFAFERNGAFQHRKRKYHPAVLLGIEWPAARIAEYV